MTTKQIEYRAVAYELYMRKPSAVSEPEAYSKWFEEGVTAGELLGIDDDEELAMAFIDLMISGDEEVGFVNK